MTTPLTAPMTGPIRVGTRRSLLADRGKGYRLQAVSNEWSISHLHIIKSEPCLQHWNHIFLPLHKIPRNDPLPCFFYQP